MPAASRHPSKTLSAVIDGEVASVRKPTNVSLSAELVAEARELGVNVSQAAEVGIAAAVARHRQERWLADNQAALESSNEFVEQHGLPLTRYRRF